MCWNVARYLGEQQNNTWHFEKFFPWTFSLEVLHVLGPDATRPADGGGDARSDPNKTSRHRCLAARFTVIPGPFILIPPPSIGPAPLRHDRDARADSCCGPTKPFGGNHGWRSGRHCSVARTRMGTPESDRSPVVPFRHGNARYRSEGQSGATTNAGSQCQMRRRTCCGRSKSEHRTR